MCPRPRADLLRLPHPAPCRPPPDLCGSIAIASAAAVASVELRVKNEYGVVNQQRSHIQLSYLFGNGLFGICLATFGNGSYSTSSRKMVGKAECELV